MAQSPKGGLYGPPSKGHLGLCAITLKPLQIFLIDRMVSRTTYESIIDSIIDDLKWCSKKPRLFSNLSTYFTIDKPVPSPEPFLFSSNPPTATPASPATDASSFCPVAHAGIRPIPRFGPVEEAKTPKIRPVRKETKRRCGTKEDLETLSHHESYHYKIHCAGFWDHSLGFGLCEHRMYYRIFSVGSICKDCRISVHF